MDSVADFKRTGINSLHPARSKPIKCGSWGKPERRGAEREHPQADPLKVTQWGWVGGSSSDISVPARGQAELAARLVYIPN